MNIPQEESIDTISKAYDAYYENMPPYSKRTTSKSA
jgi:hypothetical protein